jgi:hypothetical protein
MSTESHEELAEEMAVKHIGPEPVLLYAPLGMGERVEPPYDDLDPGIRNVVRWLFDNGFNPTDSGDGVSKGDAGLDYPHVFMVAHGHLEAEVERLDAFLRDRGIKVEGSVQGNYAPGGPAIVVLTGVTDALLR